MNKISIELNERSYSVFVGSGLLKSLGDRLRSLGLQGKAGLVTDENVRGHYMTAVEDSLWNAGFEPVTRVLPAGERSKSAEAIDTIYDKFLDSGWERGFPVIALGGGVVGDDAGFVAATLLRGVPFVQIPTSLLAQVDSSVGGKVGINHTAGKNLIGAFYQPRAVYTDVSTLHTLPEREVYCGIAEVVKYGLILDLSFAELLNKRFGELISLSDSRLTEQVVVRCVELKAKVVAEDEKEEGLRMILNFGHTFGHGAETAAGHGVLTHGEAIAFGMLCAIELSRQHGMLADRDADFASTLVQRIPLPSLVKKLATDSILSVMERDKKVSGGNIRLVLLEGIGRAVVRTDVDGKEILNVIETIQDSL